MELAVKHALSIAHGIGAALGCAAVFYLAGLVFLPRRRSEGLARGESPGFLGAAVYAVACWYGVWSGVPIARLAPAFTGVVLLIALIRRKWIRDAIRASGVLTRQALGWLTGFVLFYVLTYLFTLPPVTDDFLPTAWTGNIDLLTYLIHTKYALHLGPANWLGFNYLGDQYLQTPAVFHFFGFLSQFFGLEPLRAAMPLQFALAAFLALVMARIASVVFGLSRRSAWLVGAVVISGSFFRYVVGAYYLSTMMSAPVLLYLIWATLMEEQGRAVRFASAYLLLLFLYPFLLVAGICAQLGVIGLKVSAERFSGTDPRTWRAAGLGAARSLLSMAAPLALMTIVFRERLVWSLDEVRNLSVPGIAGWPLDIISPLALFGIPTARTDHGMCNTCLGIEALTPIGRVGALVTFVAVAALGVGLVWRARRKISPTQATLVVLASGSLIAYAAYYLLVGPSYQQWKLASYSALLLSFALLGGAWGRGRPALAAVCIVGNLLVHGAYDWPLIKFPAALGQIAALDQQPTFRELTIKMDQAFNPFSTELALYFLPSKQIHVVGQRVEPNEPLSYDTVSRQRPLLIEGFGCEGIGHEDTMTLPSLGCLLYAPPSALLDTVYPFNRTFLFLELDNIGRRETAGRWNVGPAAHIRLLVDVKRVWAYDDLYVSLGLAPYVPPGTERQRIRLTWGKDHHADVSLRAPESISLPISRADWDGDREWALTIAMEFPDAIPPHWMYIPDGHTGDGTPLAVLFENIAIAKTPAGRVVKPTGSPD